MHIAFYYCKVDAYFYHAIVVEEPGWVLGTVGSNLYTIVVVGFVSKHAA